MTLGIMVNSDIYPEQVVGLTRAAVARGHEVIVFATDCGTRMLAEPEVYKLSELQGVHMSYCRHNAESMEADTEGLPKAIVASSQMDNAIMNNKADKVLVL